MRLGCQECRSDVKSNLKFNRSNDVSNSKWVSENSHSFIDQCCVGANLTGRLTHAVWALTSLGGSVLLNSTLSGGGPPFRVFSETPRAFSQRALTSLSIASIFIEIEAWQIKQPHIAPKGFLCETALSLLVVLGPLGLPTVGSVAFC
jgi:hypothetical protein